MHYDANNDTQFHIFLFRISFTAKQTTNKRVTALAWNAFASWSTPNWAWLYHTVASISIVAFVKFCSSRDWKSWPQKWIAFVARMRSRWKTSAWSVATFDSFNYKPVVVEEVVKTAAAKKKQRKNRIFQSLESVIVWPASLYCVVLSHFHSHNHQTHSLLSFIV